MPEFATTPDLTALWHEKQKMIEVGEIKAEALLEEIDMAIANEISRVSEEVTTIASLNSSEHKCPNCGNSLIQRNGKNGTFWGCSNYPNCTTTFPDNKGKPNFAYKKGSGNSRKASYIKSSNAVRTTGISGNSEILNTETQNFTCPKCETEGRQGQLIRRPSKKNPKMFWWGCSQYKNGCDSAFDANGKPKNSNQ